MVANKVKEYCLITGASSGLGKALSFELKEKNLILVSRNKEELAQLKQKITTDKEILIFSCDLTKEDERIALMEFCQNQGNITWLINNAGVGYYQNFDQTNWSYLKQIIDLNILATTHLTHHFIKHMKTHGVPSQIIQISSLTAHLPVPKFAVYSGSKNYINRLSEILNEELRTSSIKILNVCPGGIDTNFSNASNQTLSKNARSSLMKPQKIAKLILKKAGRKNNYIPGIENKVMAALYWLFGGKKFLQIIGKISKKLITPAS